MKKKTTPFAALHSEAIRRAADTETKDSVRCSAWMDDALTVARKVMYQRTQGLTLEESDKLMTWIDAALSEVKKAASSIDNHDTH